MRKTGQPITQHFTDNVNQILKRRRSVVEKDFKQELPNMYIFNILKVDVEKVSSEEATNAISSATAMINKKLKLIAVLTKVKKNLTSHVARHSFATLLITKKVDIYCVKELLG